MIEGLKFQVPSAELKAHLESRAIHHRSRQAAYEHQVISLPPEDPEERVKNASSNSLKDSLDEKAKSHQARAELFEWRANHVAVDETYSLSENDLQTVEITTRGRY